MPHRFRFLAVGQQCTTASALTLMQCVCYGLLYCCCMCVSVCLPPLSVYVCLLPGAVEVQGRAEAPPCTPQPTGPLHCVLCMVGKPIRVCMCASCVNPFASLPPHLRFVLVVADGTAGKHSRALQDPARAERRAAKQKNGTGCCDAC